MVTNVELVQCIQSFILFLYHCQAVQIRREEEETLAKEERKPHKPMPFVLARQKKYSRGPKQQLIQPSTDKKIHGGTSR